MKVKKLFNRNKSKKKKNVQQTSTVGDVTSNNGSSDKLIIPPDSKTGNASGKENDPVNSFENSVEYYSKENVVLRAHLKKNAQNYVGDSDLEETKTRGDSTSSNNSTKATSRRPWSFFEQLRRQDSRESAYSTGSSARTSQPAEDLIASTPPPRDDASRYSRGDAPSLNNRNSCTLPRTITPEQFEQASKTAPRQDHSAKRRTMDFRFFNFFKRSSSGDSSVHSDTISPSSTIDADSSRSSLRGKNKGKKRIGKKRREEESKSMKSRDSLNDNRIRSFSEGGESSVTMTLDDALQVAPIGLYDSALKLNSVDEQPDEILKSKDRRVPVNGEPAFFLGDDVTDSTHRCTSEVSLNKGSRKYMRRSDPTSGGHSILRLQMSEGSVVVRSSSDSADSRRSSFVCEPRDSPLPEDSIASFDSSAYLGARARKMHGADSVPLIPYRLRSQKISRALSNDIPSEPRSIGVQACCSQSVSNLPSISVDHGSPFIPRSSSDVENARSHKKTPKPSPHQKKQDEYNALRAGGTSVSADFIAPPSPVLRAIGYPGVVLRRNKQKRNNQRPNSAFADQRMQHVMSLNMEDLPTYSQMRREMAKSGGNAYPSYEDILALQECEYPPKRGSNGVQFASTASGRAKRRGATLSHYGQRASAGYPIAASVEDGLNSLSSSNYGSKQSLSDRLDDDEVLNAFLARSHAVTHTSSGSLRNQEPSSKRAKAIRKSVVSLANLISPGKPNQKGGKLQRSSSFKESGSATASNNAAVYSFKPYRPPSNTPNKTKNNRSSKLWCETFDHNGLNEGEIKWQEAIFELYQGERDLVQDLTMAKQTYRDSMVTLKMLSDEEVALIFGKLGCLLPLHEELLTKLEQARGEDGRTLAIAYIFVEWFPRISTAYRDYCANQSDAKYALDAAVERDARVRDFLQRCLESPFSRKLDLWSYLDLPRTRLVKYPLLLQNVLKRTPGELSDERNNLTRVMEIIGEIIEKVDETTGEQQCRYIRSKLEYLDDKHRSPFVDNSRLMLCSGQLKNNRGTKMHVFLFEEAFVLTRQTTRSNKIAYQVYRYPLPLRTLVVDTNEGDKLSGSFRGGILSSEKVKHSFRVKSEELNITYTLQASEEHDRKQWINAILDALSKYKAKHPDAAAGIQPSRRRATYDPSSKKLNSRSVLRSSSDKSNASVASSDKSSVQEESQEDDASLNSEDTGPWQRTRSHTVNPSLLTSKSGSSVSRKSSGSSTKSDKSTDSKGSKSDKVDGKKLKDRLRILERGASGPPSPLKDAPRKLSASISRHFSLSGADKPKIVIRTRSDDAAKEAEKARNKCQRSRSLTSSPQTVKSVVARFGVKRFSHGKISASGLLAPTAGKPPIAPSASPFSVRRTPSLKAPCTIHEAQSTPNLAVARSTSFCTRRSSTRLSQLAAQNSSNSVGNLRKGLTGGSSTDLRSESLERRVQEARMSRRARSADKAASEGDDTHDSGLTMSCIPSCGASEIHNASGANTQPEPSAMEVPIENTEGSCETNAGTSIAFDSGEKSGAVEPHSDAILSAEDAESGALQPSSDAILSAEDAVITDSAEANDNTTQSDDTAMSTDQEEQHSSEDSPQEGETSGTTNAEMETTAEDSTTLVVAGSTTTVEAGDSRPEEDVSSDIHISENLSVDEANDGNSEALAVENSQTDVPPVVEISAPQHMECCQSIEEDKCVPETQEECYPSLIVEDEAKSTNEVTSQDPEVIPVTEEVLGSDYTSAADGGDVEMKVLEDKNECPVESTDGETSEGITCDVQEEVKQASTETEKILGNQNDNTDSSMDCDNEDKEDTKTPIELDVDSPSADNEDIEDTKIPIELDVDSPSTDNDEGIVQDAGTASDVDNNNVQQTSDKTLPDSETDEQIFLETESETSNCCQTEITDENSNRQLDLQTSV